MKERIEKLVGHSEHLLDAFLGFSQKVALFLPMISDDRLFVRFMSGQRAEGFQVLRYALFCDCAQDIVKLALDRDDRTPSVANLIDILSDKAVRSTLRQRYSAWRLPRESGDEVMEQALTVYENQRQSKLASEFDTKFEALHAAWEDFQSQQWVTGFRILRDKHTAHLELRKTNSGYQLATLDSLHLQWGDLRDASARLEALVLVINALARQAGFAIEQAKDQFAQMAESFWREDAC